MLTFDFNAKKSAQAVAILLNLNGGSMDKYILIKMLYLADKEALKKWNEPITGDRAASMEYGPVLSNVYDLTKGDCPHFRAEWSPYISDAHEETNQVACLSDPGNGELSKAEIKILESVYGQFKDFSWKQMRDYCHRFPEYDASVGKSSKPIQTEAILKALGKTDEEIREARKTHQEMKWMDLLLG